MGKEVNLSSLRLRSNEDTLNRFAEAIARRQLQRAYEILQEANTTSDFPILMGNAANRVLQGAYRQVPDLWRKICNIGEIKDFREKEIIRVSEAEDLEEIREMAEVRESTLSEASEKTKLAIYAKKFNVGWKTVVNDDLGAIRAQPNRFGRASGRLLNKLAFQGVLEGNPTMGDSTPLFHADHGNLGSAELAESSLKDAFTAIRKQKDENGNPIDLIVNKPKLVVPLDLEWTANSLVNPAAIIVSGGGSVPTTQMQGKAEVVVAPYLTDPNDWYLIVDPNDSDTIAMDFLRMIGENPQLFMKANEWMFVGGGQAGIEQFDHEYLVRHVAAAKAVEYRAMYKSSPVNG